MGGHFTVKVYVYWGSLSNYHEYVNERSLSSYQKHVSTRLAEDACCSTNVIYSITEKHHLWGLSIFKQSRLFYQNKCYLISYSFLNLYTRKFLFWTNQFIYFRMHAKQSKYHAVLDKFQTHVSWKLQMQF